MKNPSQIVEITIGAENITYIKKIGGNLCDVTRCNTLHHLNCQELIRCNVFWCCSFGVVMVPLGWTHIHDARRCLALFVQTQGYKLQGPKMMQSIASLNAD